MKSKQVLAMVCVLAAATPVFAQTTINFDNATSTIGTDLGNFYTGVTFGADEQVTGQVIPEFPARSVPNILTDVNIGNPTMTISFASPVASFSFWYASFAGFTGTAYAANGTTVVGTFTGNQNVTVGALTTLQQTGVANGSADISFISFTDNSGLGTGIAIDDLTFSANVPDAASTLALFGVAALGLLSFRRKVVA